MPEVLARLTRGTVSLKGELGAPPTEAIRRLAGAVGRQLRRNGCCYLVPATLRWASWKL